MAPQAQTRGSRWEILQTNAHRPDVQEEIRREIRQGTIRVVPAPDGGIRIIPLAGPAGTPEPPEPPRHAYEPGAPRSGPRLARAWSS